MRLVTSLKGVKVAFVKAVIVAFLVSVSFQASADTKEELQSKLSTLNALSSTFSQLLPEKMAL